MVPLALALLLATAPAEPASASANAAPPPPSLDAGAPAADATPVPVLAPAPAGRVGAARPALASAPSARLAAITLAPQQLDPGPFRAGEVAGATLGAFGGDALVLATGYLALRMFADGTIPPTATNFRRAIYGFGVAALVVPPLTGVLVASLFGGPHARGGLWKAMLLASAGQLAALAAGYYMAPRFWVVLPVQALALSLGASFGLHWGSHARAAPEAPDPSDEVREGPPSRPDATAAIATPLCTDS